MDGQAPPLGDLIQQWSAKIQSIAYREFFKWRTMIRSLEPDDLVQHGYVKLISLYREGRIDWSNSGANAFIEISLLGHIRNVITGSAQKDTVMALGRDVISTDDEGADSRPWVDALTANHRHDETYHITRSMLRDLNEYLDDLPPADALILVGRILDGRSREELGLVLGVSRETIRRKEASLQAGMIQYMQTRGWDITDLEENA